MWGLTLFHLGLGFGSGELNLESSDSVQNVAQVERKDEVKCPLR